MNPICNIVAERVALGEPLGEHAEHATTCERCQRVVALPSSLAATHAVTAPSPGFAARMTVGAQRRLVVRRRNRVIASVGASALAAAAIAFVITRPPMPRTEDHVATNTQKPDETVHLDDSELKLLVTDTDRAARAGADWRHITKPLHPYRNLVKGIK